LIVEKDGQAVFARQPATDAERLMAWRARLLCPTASVKTETHAVPPEDDFPEKLTDGVYRLGYNAASSHGAHSFAIRRQSANAMVAAPRWTGAVGKTFEDWGGRADILLTHHDDIAFAERYAARFATNILEGAEPFALAENLLAIPVPDQTKGIVA
jgi:hypothetical protein